jgi:hypothetical protein
LDGSDRADRSIVLAAKGNVQVFGGSGLLLVTLAPAAQK